MCKELYSAGCCSSWIGAHWLRPDASHPALGGGAVKCRCSVSLKTVSECQARCDAEAGCAGFEYRHRGGMCKPCGNALITRTNKDPAVACHVKPPTAVTP